MANAANPQYLNIARPYAVAAFDSARDQNKLLEWKAFLETAAIIAQQPDIKKLLIDPEISSEKLFALFQDVLKTMLDVERKNFLLLLLQYNRFIALPEISDLFNNFYDALEKISEIHVITAVQMDDAFKQKLSQALQKRTHSEVTLQCDVDPAILGGAIIRIGDKVIDGSVRGKLTRLLEFSLR